MIRIRYTSNEKLNSPVVLHSSTSVFKTADGRNVRVELLGDEKFLIQDIDTQEIVAEGQSKKGSATSLKRMAKTTLVALMDDSSFQKEKRMKRES